MMGLRARITGWLWREFGGEDLCDPVEIGGVGGALLSMCSATELGRDWGI